MFSLAKHSMPGNRWSDVGNGFRLAASWLLFVVWLGLVFGGLGTVSSTDSRFPPLVGWLALVIAAVTAVATMERWVKVLPAFLAYGVLNGVIMLTTGHLVNDASKRIPRSSAIAITLLGAGATVIAATFSTRKPTGFDRLAGFGVLVSLLLGLVNENYTLWSFGLMFCCLAAAWRMDRVRRRHRAR